ncbi:MAG: DNA-processing protein DprA [Deinococcus sp.]|nr:DNA-processing protein DprA [Deinococcus sp.]
MTFDHSLHRLQRDTLPYPPALVRHLGDRAPAVVSGQGNLEILGGSMLALFCSVRCPGDLILKTYDLARALRDAGVTVIGGFHSPMEKECLALLLRGKQPVVVCPARSLDEMRLPAEWRPLLTEGRLLLLSRFDGKQRRVTAELATIRNEFVAAIAAKIFIAYAGAGSKTERFCRDVLAWGKPILTLESSENANLIALGARPVQPESICEQRV